MERAEFKELLEDLKKELRNSMKEDMKKEIEGVKDELRRTHKDLCDRLGHVAEMVSLELSYEDFPRQKFGK